MNVEVLQNLEQEARTPNADYVKLSHRAYLEGLKSYRRNLLKTPEEGWDTLLSLLQTLENKANLVQKEEIQQWKSQAQTLVRLIKRDHQEPNEYTWFQQIVPSAA